MNKDQLLVDLVLALKEAQTLCFQGICFLDVCDPCPRKALRRMRMARKVIHRAMAQFDFYAAKEVQNGSPAVAHEVPGLRTRMDGGIPPR